MALLDERATLPLGAEAVVLHLHQHRRCEAVVELSHVDILRSQACPAVQRVGHGCRRLRGQGVAKERGNIDCRLRVTWSRLRDRSNRAHRMPAVACVLGRRHDDGACPVGFQAEVEPPERIRDHRCGVVVVAGHRSVAHLRRRVGVCSCPEGESDLGQRIARRSVLDLVSAEDHRPDLAWGEQPVGHEELVE
ncbi:MAG: hypothetical protein U5K30_14005 [Acidimicrobiales bacterium]|nr:hypothetical protein [Acidimicrobiales bacterium]